MTHNKKPDKAAHRKQKLQEKELLDAIHAIFKKSDLLKGQPPGDRIFLPKPCPALLKNLSLLAQVEAKNKTPSPSLTKKGTMKKSPSKKGHKT